jgi:ParB/RepB/Spo0J family partition protein
MSRIAAAISQPVEALGTALERVRCRRPVLIERMMGSLSAHGQLVPLVAVERKGRLEILDGFKRLAAAKQMGWPALQVSATERDEASQWATMLALNRGPQSMTELEEALVLREIAQTGLTQVQIAELVQRHKSWVSRRIGLVERLHPELVEGMKLGLLSPGVARRLLSLPPGNQLQIAAAAQSAGLGPRETERLVSLWQRAKDPAVQRQLLAEPRAALARAYPEISPTDPRLTPQGQQLSRLLRLVAGVAPRLSRLLPPTEEDRPVLSKQIAETRMAVSLLATSLGPAESVGSATARDGAGATGSSSS